MSEFIISCPNCNEDLTLDDEWKNLIVECPVFFLSKISPCITTNTDHERINMPMILLKI